MSEPYNDFKLYYPLDLTPRDEQKEMLKFTADSINNGNKYIMLNAPTGIGKSFSVILFINWYLNHVNKSAKFDILTNSKILQEQYINEFSYIKNLKGRNNYHCETFDTDCEKGHEICSSLKINCRNCPYKEAKAEWMQSQVGITNFHLFSMFALYNETTIDTKESNVLIIDEAHDFESVFGEYISVKLTARILKKYGFSLEEIEKIDYEISKIYSIDRFVKYVDETFLPDVNSLKVKYEFELDKASKKRKQEISKYLVYIDQQIGKLKYVVDDYKRPQTESDMVPPALNWVLEVYKNNKEKMFSGVELTAQPIWVHKQLPEKVWSKYDHIIFMSGTILDKEMFSYMNGIDSEFASYLDIDSPFPVKNRPIFYLKTGKMNYDMKRYTFDNQKIYIDKILKKYKNDKGIIHSSTYEITKWIEEEMCNTRMLFHTPEDRLEILNKHIGSNDPTVLISPSMETGIDLKDELSRFQIILKIPYPSLMSKKIKARQTTKPEWYVWKTIVDLIQSLGRSVRNKEDYCDSFILDSCFSSLMKYSSDMLPRYITKAIRNIKI